MNDVSRLFRVRPVDIFEHPPTLPVEEDQIPVGPIEGWDCYACELNGDPSKVVGPFTAAVARDENYLTITPPEGRYQFHYGIRSSSGAAPAWYQSGCTLRFIKKRS